MTSGKEKGYKLIEYISDVNRYGAFGEITYGAPQYENIYAYNGESYNPNVESLYLRARYYNVMTGRSLRRTATLETSGSR